jgi:hypothetical protein
MPQTLDQYAKAGDPLADELIAELAQQGLLQGNLQQQIATLIAADIPVARHWQEQTQTVPDWVDWQQIDQGRLLFLQHVPMAIVSFVSGHAAASICPARLGQGADPHRAAAAGRVATPV